MERDKPQGLPDCLKCLHYKLTWEPAYPHCCGVFGIKSQTIPAREVFLATGRHCPVFHGKPS
ncbi:MAG: hypothetical protein LBD74_07245 [Spirochaetaceae bacterium]|nr:hypothetical protein [Spirochaetaceae bacterium]